MTDYPLTVDVSHIVPEDCFLEIAAQDRLCLRWKGEAWLVDTRSPSVTASQLREGYPHEWRYTVHSILCSILGSETEDSGVFEWDGRKVEDLEKVRDFVLSNRKVFANPYAVLIDTGLWWRGAGWADFAAWLGDSAAHVAEQSDDGEWFVFFEDRVGRVRGGRFTTAVRRAEDMVSGRQIEAISRLSWFRREWSSVIVAADLVESPRLLGGVLMPDAVWEWLRPRLGSDVVDELIFTNTLTA